MGGEGAWTGPRGNWRLAGRFHSAGRFVFQAVSLRVGTLHPFGAADCIQNQLDARRDAQLFEYMKQIVLYGMVAEPEFFGDILVLEALGQKTDDIFFPLGQQPHSVRVHNPHWRELRKRLHDFGEFRTTGPDLARVDLLHAPAEGLEVRLRYAEDTPCSGPECVHYQIALMRVEEEDRLDVRSELADLPQCPKATERTIRKGRIDKRNIRIGRPRRFDCLLCGCRTIKDMKVLVPFQRSRLYESSSPSTC